MMATSDEGNIGEFDGVTFWTPSYHGILYTASHKGDGDYCLSWADSEGYGGQLDGYKHAYIAEHFANGTWLRGRPASEREPDISPLASLASTVAEVFAVPTREQSRRYVDMAVRSIRGESFAKAIQYVLMAMPERCTKSGISPHEIMATIDACRAWEHARGKIAPGKRTLSDADMAQLTEVATLAAWARVRARDAGGIGAIVAEFYERVRALC